MKFKELVFILSFIMLIINALYVVISWVSGEFVDLRWFLLSALAYIAVLISQVIESESKDG